MVIQNNQMIVTTRTSEINPDADEVCDGIDNDCDDSDSFNGIDEDFALDGSLFFLDSDGDGFGNILGGYRRRNR